MAPTLRCFRHLSPSYEWLVKEDSKMCKTQRLRSFGRLSAVGHVLSCHTRRRRYFLGHQWILISASVRSSEDSRICSETGLMYFNHQTNPPLTVRMNIEPSSFGTVEFCNFGDELGKASIVFLMMSSWWLVAADDQEEKIHVTRAEVTPHCVLGAPGVRSHFPNGRSNTRVT